MSDTLTSYPRARLVREAALTDRDWQEVRRCRRGHNRLGFAYQVGFVRLLNRFPNQSPFEIHDELLRYIAMQLDTDAGAINQYAARQGTVSEHQARIGHYLGYRTLGQAELIEVEKFVFTEACRLEQATQLLSRVRDFLQERSILTPADYALTRLVGQQRKKAGEQIYERVHGALTAEMIAALDALLVVGEQNSVSPLQEIKANPKKASTGAMRLVADKIATIENTGILACGLSWLNSNYQRSLFHYVRKCAVDRLRQLAPSHRYAALTCFLWQSYRDAVDQAIDIYDKMITKHEGQVEDELDERLRKQRKSIKTSLATLKSLIGVVLDDEIDDADVRGKIFNAVPRKELDAHHGDLSEWVWDNGEEKFRELVKRHRALRDFSTVFIRSVEFLVESEGSELPSLRAIQTLRDMNDKGHRKVPEDAPTEFIPKKLLSVVQTSDGIDKKGWEVAVITKLREEMRAGNIAAENSKRFGRFDDYFISEHDWAGRKDDFWRRAGLPATADDVPGFLTERLDRAYDLFLKFVPDNSSVTFDREGWHLKSDAGDKLPAEQEEELGKLKDWLSSQMRTIRLPDLLIEVDNALNFTRHFQPPGKEARDPDAVCPVLAAIMSEGCNIGPHTMAQLTEGITYKQLKRASDWLLTPDNQRAALAAIVHAISRLDATSYWGEGKTSASDGQRFAMPGKVLQQTYSTKFSDFALEFYTFVADNYAPFYSTPIECTNRDASFVLDGLLYNESDLELEEHYTDTHGYTEINFAAFAMLGRRFCPRIKGIHRQRIYRTHTERDYGVLAPLLNRKDRTLVLSGIADQWDRMGRFYASLEIGHTTASVALRRLNGYSASNRFYRANQDLGRIFKTAFILQYMSEPHLRTRVRRGLLKVELLHSLARDVYYARRGRVSARELHEQMNTCSCLTLIIACIIFWQAREMSRVLATADADAVGINVKMLEHISPIEWKNVILYGQYNLNRSSVRRTA